MSTPLISVQDAQSAAEHYAWVDCRFQLTDPDAGLRAYRDGHVPGARYASLDEHLSDLSRGAGRHPLPALDAFGRDVSAWGIDKNTPVIAYDAGSGLFASRLWWLLTVTGHDRVQVLNGGLAAWTAAGGPLSQDEPVTDTRRYAPRLDSTAVVELAELEVILAEDRGLLVDARGAERYRGDNEPIDAKAGHVPGAVNFPYEDNLQDNRFSSPEALRDAWTTRLGGRPPETVVHMCGSGVTACGNRLAMDHAGLPGSRVYVGSWSEWIADPERPVATGDG